MRSAIQFHVAPPSKVCRRFTPPTTTWLVSFGFTHNAASYQPWPFSSNGVVEAGENVAPAFVLR